MAEALEVCAGIFGQLGVDKSRLILGIINAGHPGGMLPLTTSEAGSLHSALLPENVYAADATLFPESLGNPPFLTILALAKRVSKVCVEASLRN